MYVSVPKNYSGVAFREKEKTAPSRIEEEIKKEELDTSPALPEKCEEECEGEAKSPLQSVLKSLGTKGKSDSSQEELLLVGLIALLIGKDGNAEIILILAMLLLI